MIAMTISLIVLVTICQVFVDSKSMYRYTENMSRVQENGRFAMFFLSEDIRNSKFGICNPAEIVNHLNNPDEFYQNEESVRGYTYTGSGSDLTDWTPNLPSIFNPGEVIPGTDVLHITRVGSGPYKIDAPYMPDTASSLHIIPGPGLNVEDIVMVTDCKKADIFQIVSPSNLSNGTLVHNTGAGASPGNASKVFSQTYGPGSELVKFVSYYYFIGSDSNGVPTLFRLSLNSGIWEKEELVGNIENLALLFGQDTSGDKSVDSYMTADLVLDWAKNKSVQVGIVSRSPERILRESNDYRRQNFSSVVKIREYRK